ncbi:hypothetical protein [Streptomyces sp. NPDC058614]|uniref:hypothetical protein n=1 Tax=Streptomyces sp. NPDC058614 TaxID=3346557 RepID=UPI00364DE935
MARGEESEAGFADLASWRERRRYEGPVVFFAGRVTPNHLLRSRELGAEITASGGELIAYIGGALRRETPSRA